MAGYLSQEVRRELEAWTRANERADWAYQVDQAYAEGELDRNQYRWLYMLLLQKGPLPR